MNTSAALKTLSSATGPVVLAAGAATLSVALVTSARSVTGPRASGPRPVSTVTVTASATVVGRPTVEPSGGASGTPTPTVVAAGPAPGRTAPAQPIGAQQVSGGRPESPVPGGSSPAPGTGPHTSCRGTVAAVQLPLGALPCAITIGGHR